MSESSKSDDCADVKSDSQQTNAPSRDDSGPAQGRRAHSAWSYFTNIEAPWRERAAACMHCGKTVSYNKKNEIVQKHLRHCTNFIQVMKS